MVFELVVNIGLQMIYLYKHDRVIAMIKRHVKMFVFAETLWFMVDSQNNTNALHTFFPIGFVNEINVLGIFVIPILYYIFKAGFIFYSVNRFL